MAIYTKTTDFAAKDSLTLGDPLKRARGTEVDTEFVNIATAIETLNTGKADTAGSATNAFSAITAVAGTNTTQVATTAFVQATVGIGFKNKIIGGDFTINPWQRGTSFPAIASNAYFADRWLVAYSTTAVVTASKVADAPTAAQAGIFTQHCLSLAVTTADTSIAATDQFRLRYIVEGLNAVSFGFGQAGSRSVTLSFWVKGTKTGIHCVAFRNGAQDRVYVAEYTIATTNTWEYKTITIPVDTAGTWLYNNSNGLNIDFALAMGTNFHTTANTWAAGTGGVLATANQVNALDSTANTFKIALVQLEAGSVATKFDVRSVDQEKAMCQRYYQIIGDSSTNSVGITAYASAANEQYYHTIRYMVEMRAVPYVDIGTFVVNNTDQPNFLGAGVNSITLSVTSLAAGGMGARSAGLARPIQLTAEL